jgi:hypothetical protein
MQWSICMFVAISKENLHSDTDAKSWSFLCNAFANYCISPNCDKSAHAGGEGAYSGNNQALRI